MISVHLKPRLSDHPNASPRVLAVFSFRYDAHLVPDLIENISPMVDGWVSFDDRHSQELFSDEPSRRHALLLAARQAGAQWILAVDPDERFESGLASAMPALTNAAGSIAYTFVFRELFHPEQYRVDGIWGKKNQTRMFRMPDEIIATTAALHAPWHNMMPNPDVRASGFNIYHLKMITAARRRGRADLYNHLDPLKKFQPFGYDYLADDDGAVLEQIPDHRIYQPIHHDDDGLWMPATTGKIPFLHTDKTTPSSFFRRLTTHFFRR